MKAYLTLIVSLLPFALQGQIITTIAGTGSSLYSGNGTAAVSAGIPNPCGGVFDKYNNYYFADINNSQRIRKINSGGIITDVAGNGMGGFSGDNGLAISAELYEPEGVKLDTLGNIYVADAGNNRIRKINASTGIITTIAGNGTGAFSGNDGPATAASIYNPQDIAVDKFGNIYISDMFNYRVRKVNASGIITTYAGTGVQGFSGDHGPATAAQLDYPAGLAVDDTGNLYIADWGGFANRVRKINTSGIITTVAGNGSSTYISDGSPATSTAIAPIFIALDAINNLFIADRYNNRVYEVFATSGILHCVAGNGVAGDSGDNGPATGASLYTPTGVALDSCGNLYIPTIGDLTVPGSGRRIRKVALNPACWPESVETPAKPTSITLYPNPTYSTITITAPVPINNVTITNTLGQQVYTHTFTASKAQIDISQLPQGMYIVRVNDVYVQKLVKE